MKKFWENKKCKEKKTLQLTDNNVNTSIYPIIFTCMYVYIFLLKNTIFSIFLLHLVKIFFYFSEYSLTKLFLMAAECSMSVS